MLSRPVHDLNPSSRGPADTEEDFTDGESIHFGKVPLHGTIEPSGVSAEHRWGTAANVAATREHDLIAAYTRHA